MDCNTQLKDRLKLLLNSPAFIGDLPELYETKFSESLDIDRGLLKFVDSCDYLKLRGSYVEYSDSPSDPAADNLLFGTLEGRLKFLLPSTRALFYEHLPHLYKLVFGETFECGSNLLHFIESYPYLEISCYVFVKYSELKSPPSFGNPRHKQFLTRRFIYLLRLFPKSPPELIKMYKEQFGEDPPVQPRILPAIFRNFLKNYFMVSASNMIYFATPTKTPEVPEIPPRLIESNSDPSSLVIDRLTYLKFEMKLESRYLQFMYCDIFGEPINDFATLERFVSTGDQPAIGAFDRALVWMPDKPPTSIEVIKELLSSGPMKISDLFKAWSAGKPDMAEIFRENNAFVEILLHVPGVMIVSQTVRLADSSLDYVNRQIERLIEGSVNFKTLPGLFKKAYGYTIPDDYLLREYVLHTGTLRIDSEENVTNQQCKKTEIPTPSTSSRASSTAGDNCAPNVNGDLDVKLKSEVVKLIGRKAARFDKIKMLYERRFHRELKLGTKLSSWLQTIDGLRCDTKNQIVYSAKLSEAQAQVIAVVMERKEINFENIPAECKMKFKKDLEYKGQLKPWLCNIPGLVISPTKICTYIEPLCGGSTLDLTETKSTHSKSTPDVRPRTQEELVIDLIIAKPNSTINDFLKLFIETHGKKPSYKGKLKTYLLSIPGVRVSPNDRINMEAADVATNAKERIDGVLKDGNWMSVETFAEIYHKQYGISAGQTWIQSRQKEIEFLMLLNQKVRYRVLDNATCLKYVKHLANLCGPLTMDEVKRFFPIAYGFTLPEKMLSLIVQLHPTGKVEVGPATKLKVEIADSLKTLSPAQRRASMHLTQTKRWIRIGDLLREARIELASHIDESVFCESIPDVMIKNSRIKQQKWDPSAMSRNIQRIVSWLGLVRVSDLPMLAKRLYGFTVTMDNLPLDEMKLCSSVEETDGYLRWKLPQTSSSITQFSPEILIAHSDSQLHRLFRLVAEIPDIQLDKLEELYMGKFGAPVITCTLSFKMYIDQHPEFSVTNGRVALNVPLVEALKEPQKLPAADLSRNLLSAQVCPLKPAESSKLNNTETQGLEQKPEASNVAPRVLAPNIVNPNQNLKTENSDTPSFVGITSSPEAVYSETNSRQVELSFFGSLIGDREREIRVLCNDYKNKFKTRITEEQLQKLLLAAGYCCIDGLVHPGCKDRLRFLLSARELDQTSVIIEFQALFARSPCYTGTLGKYLRSIGCTESTGKRYRFSIKRNSAEPIDDQMLERLLPIIGFRNKSVDVSRVLEEYNCRHDPQLTQETLLSELGKLDFVVLTKKKKAFDCGGIHETSVEALETYLGQPGSTLSFPNLAHELREKTGKNLLYFGNLLKALQKAGFSVSNDVVSQEKQQNTSAQSSLTEDRPSSVHDLTEVRAIIKDILRRNSPMTYDDLEMNFKKASGYQLHYSQLGCSNFSSFLKVYLPDDGMIFEDEVISCDGSSDGSRNSSSRTSPARSSDQSCENVFDVIRASGPLVYPSELQARFAELTGTFLRIPDPDAYLLQLLRATELIVKSDQFGKIRVCMTPSCDCEEESFRSVEEEWEEEERIDQLVREAMS